MLSMSAELSDTDIDLQIINGQHSDEFSVPYASELMSFAEAVASRDATALYEAREALLELAGPEVLVDAAGVAANFQRMVRIADAAGIPVDDIMMAASANIQEELELRRFGSAENPPRPSWLQRLLNIPKRFMVRRFLRKADQRANAA